MWPDSVWPACAWPCHCGRSRQLCSHQRRKRTTRSTAWGAICLMAPVRQARSPQCVTHSSLSPAALPADGFWCRCRVLHSRHSPISSWRRSSTGWCATSAHVLCLPISWTSPLRRSPAIAVLRSSLSARRALGFWRPLQIPSRADRGRTGARSSRRGARVGLGLLGFDELFQHASEVRERRVRQNRKRPKVRILLEGLLLVLDDRLVLHEPFDQAVQERSGNSGVVTLEIVEVHPEEVRRALGLRRHVLTVAIFARILDFALLGALTRGRKHGLHIEYASYEHRHVIAPVHPRILVANNFLVKRR